jgi:hypothetical protein
MLHYTVGSAPLRGSVHIEVSALPEGARRSQVISTVLGALPHTSHRALTPSAGIRYSLRTCSSRRALSHWGLLLTSGDFSHGA